MRSRFFWRLYATYTLVVVITATGIGVLVDQRLRDDLDQDIENRLRAEAHTLVPHGRELFRSGDAFGAEAAVHEVGAATGTRITLVAPDGRVLSDSLEGAALMDNHGDRPEIRDALASGQGIARRYSETTRTHRLYVAVRVDEDSETLGLVRTSITLAATAQVLADARMQTLQGAIVGALLALFFGVFVARRVTAPIAEMSEVSESLRRGDYSARVHVRRSDELGILAENLNQLGGELTERIDRLSRQQAQLDAFIGSMQEGVVAINRNDRVVFSNLMGRRLLHLDPDEQQIDLEQLPAGLSEVVQEVRNKGTRTRREIAQVLDDDELVLDARGAPFTAGEQSGVVLVLYDITNMRRLERVRTDFVANVSHELKTPLTSIQGYVETLLDGAIHDVEHNTRFLQKMATQVRRLSTLVSDLLSLARIESTTYSSELERVDLREIVAESVARRRDPLADKNLAIEVRVPDRAAIVEGDAESLRQVVDNLLDNAINYTSDEGRIVVELSTQGLEHVLTIEDTGMGIPDDAIDRIFERFYRVDKGRSRELGGTGLGLSIVRNLVHRMQGSVSVESEVGVGSVFTVELPRAEDELIIDDFDNDTD